MSVRDEIAREMKEALRSGQKKRVSVLRMLLNELTMAEKSGQKSDEQQVLQAYAKKLKKSAEEYQELERPETAREVLAELEIVREFLPEQMNRQEISQLIDQIVEENGYGPRDLGKVMKQVMGEHGPRVDGGMVNEIAREKLSERD
jgi:hypothetical protein